MKICFCDRCGREIDESTCEQLKYDENEPLELCDDCYSVLTEFIFAWLRPSKYEIVIKNINS